MSIFISIASYRDPELEPTIRDCIAKAARPDELTFGVCWQHGPEESAPNIAEQSRVRLIDVDFRRSNGACWARAEIMKLWDGEEWFLQIDSHHRFVPRWDEVLLDQAERSGSDRPVLTTYAPPYSPNQLAPLEYEPMAISFDRFSEDGIAMFRPSYIPNWRNHPGPYRGRFASAHLLFAPGRFVHDVPYDPDLYFTGEEISIAVRAFTHGYDLFVPSRLVLWHEYTRAYRRKHWDDHIEQTDIAWWQRDSASRTKINRFLADRWVGEFGCGTVRTVREFEDYAGISFTHRRVHDYTRRNAEPPNPPVDREWPRRTKRRRVKISLDRSELPDGAVEEASFWYVGVHDAAGNELFREDATRDELLAASTAGADASIEFVRIFESTELPVTWTVIPYKDDWLPAITRPVIRLCPRRLSGFEHDVVDGGFAVTSETGAPQVVNHTGMFLLEIADGTRSIDDLAAVMRNAYQLPVDPIEEVASFFDASCATGLVDFVTAEGGGSV